MARGGEIARHDGWHTSGTDLYLSFGVLLGRGFFLVQLNGRSQVGNESTQSNEVIVSPCDGDVN